MAVANVLFVDDEEGVLNSFRRLLRQSPYAVHTAASGDAGLDRIRQERFAVIVSDMRMPQMDGAAFLKQAHRISPDSVRILLTGQADLDSAIAAVNEGRIFRFLTKPCPPDVLTATLEIAMDQYRLVTAERELLENTLSGSVNVLTEILSLVNPIAFSRAARIKRYASQVAGHLGLLQKWQFEVAAMLSQVGCVTLPPDLLNKVYADQPLSEEEKKLFSSHPTVGRTLLANIPRLELVARMIEGQQHPFRIAQGISPSADDKVAKLGAEILKAVLDFDAYLAKRKSAADALALMQGQEGEYNPVVLEAMRRLDADRVSLVPQTVTVNQLTTTMVLDEDVLTKNGVLLVVKGQEVTYPVIERLRIHATRGAGVKQPFRVLAQR